MAEYKWVALSNTTIGVMMATINQTILLISLPDIFKGISLNAYDPGNFQFLLWILLGFNIVTATLLLTFGRLSDMYGRVRLFNMGFAIFTAGSLFLYITPGTGTFAATYLVTFRIVQGIGAAFLFANSAAILTDAFPSNERGTALGINSIAAIGGSLMGIILGGVLAVLDWRYVFLVSVPFGALGTIWSYLKLKDNSQRDKTQRLDYAGNITFAVGLTLVLVGIVYGLMPDQSAGSTTGWANPWVIASFVAGLSMLIAFPFIEKRVKYPMFRLSLFKIRPFAFGNISNLLAAMARGGVMIMLIILLQGIYLPLHGYTYASTPFWAGIYMVPMTIGFMIMSPISGKLSDKYGARGLATIGMVLVALAFLFLAIIPLNSSDYYYEFAGAIALMGVGNGLFSSPNSAAIMNAVPRETRGVSSGMRATLMNTGMTVSIGLFFTVVIVGLSGNLPGSFSTSLDSVGASNLIPVFDKMPPTTAMFSAFLGQNPVSQLLQSTHLASQLSPSLLTTLESKTWFPHALEPAFVFSLHLAFIIGALMAIIAAVVSVSRGRMFVYEDEYERKDPEKEVQDLTQGAGSAQVPEEVHAQETGKSEIEGEAESGGIR